MSTFDAVDHYFSGQGVVMIGARDEATGLAKGLFAVGNCSAVKLTIATTTLEHKESHTGQRGIDLRLTTEIKGTLAITMENYIAKNIAQALRGSVTKSLGAAVVAQADKAYLTGVMALGKLNVSAVAIKRGVTALTAYTNDITPYDYKLNADAGSIQFNPGTVVKMDKITTGGVAPTAITVGNPTVVTVTNAASVGDFAVFTGFTGADAALLNGLPYAITVQSPTAVSLDIDTTGKTITLGAPLSCFDGQAVTCDFTYATQYFIDSLNQGLTEVWVRFEGLNTAEADVPVVVEVFRFSSDPLKDLDLISDGIQQFVMEGSVLADSTKASGSKYFTVQTTR